MNKTHKFRSNFEKWFAEQLEKRGYEYDYELFIVEYTEPVRKGYCEACGDENVRRTRNYIPDFFLPAFSIFIETKGRFTSSDRTLLRRVKESQKDLDLRIVFQADKRLTKTSSTKWSDWADKNDFPNYVTNHSSKYPGSFPNEWFNNNDN